MGVLDLQRRGQQIGRIRLGEQVSTGKQDKNGNDRMRPSRLSTFRFTTQSRVTADAIAELYGGTVGAWNKEFEVVTKESAIGVTVPPRDQVVSQWYEMWSAGGASRRCDSQREQISGGRCLCPHAKDPGDEDEVARCALERAGLAKLSPPQACKLITRISVMIPDLPGLGVFRLDTHSFYAASEIGDTAAIMQMARDKNIFLPAILRIEQRTSVSKGETKHYPVPVLEITATFRQIAGGELAAAGITAQLPPPAAGQPKAITAGTSDLPGRAEATRAPLTPPTAGPAGESQVPANARFGLDLELEPDAEPWQVATAIYERAKAAATADEFKAWAAKAKELGVDTEHARTSEPDAADGEAWEELTPALQALWREKAAGAA